MHLYLISLKRAKHTCTDNCKSQWVPPTRFHHPCPSCLSVTIHQVPPGFLTQQRFSPTKLDMCEPKLDKCEPRLDMCEPRWPTIFIVVTAASAVTLTCPSSDLSSHQSSPQQWQIGRSMARWGLCHQACCDNLSPDPSCHSAFWHAPSALLSAYWLMLFEGLDG